MRRYWYLPVTVFGLGGLGFLCLSERGREALRRLSSAASGPRLEEWNEAAQHELDRLQASVDRLAKSLQVAEGN